MLSSHPDGVVIDVWVVPGASRDEVVGAHGDALKVRTAAPPEGGKANRRVAEIVADAVGGTSGRVVAGLASRRKKVVVAGVTPQVARRRLGLDAAGPSARLG